MAKIEKKTDDKQVDPGVITISLDDLDALIEKRMKQQETIYRDDRLASAIDNLASSSRPANSRFALSPINPRDIDPNDYVEEGVKFFTLTIGRTVFDDVRFGRPVSTPFGTPIKFKPVYRFNKGSERSRDKQTISVSATTLHSQKEIDWMRNHSGFGIQFFEDINTAVRYDHQYMNVLNEVMNYINRMNDLRVVETCKREGIQITDTNIDVYRKKLAHKLTEKRMAKGQSVHKVNAVSQDFDPNNKADRDKVVEKV